MICTDTGASSYKTVYLSTCSKNKYVEIEIYMKIPYKWCFPVER